MEHTEIARKRSSQFEEAVDKVNEEFEAVDVIILKKHSSLFLALGNTEESILRQLEAIRQAYTKKASSKEGSLMTLKNFAKGISITSKRVYDQKSEIGTVSSLKMSYLVSGISSLASELAEQSPKIPNIRTNIPKIKFDPTNEKIYHRAVYLGFEPIERNIFSIVDHIRTTGKADEISHELGNPAGVAVNPVNGNVLVADNNHGRVVVFTHDLQLITTFGSVGNGKGCFQDVSDVAVSFDGEVIAVADRGNSRIQIFNSSYKLTAVTPCKHPTEVRTCSPFGICFDEDNNIYAAVSNAGVAKYSKSGEFLMSFGGSTSPNHVQNPHGIMINDDNELYVLSRPDDKVHVFDTDGSFIRYIPIQKTRDNWNFLTRCGGKDFAVSDCSGDTIAFYDGDGTKLHSIKQVLPSGITFGINNHFYVVNCRDCIVYQY